MLINVRKLVSLSVGEKLPDIGPAEVEAMLAQKVAEGKLKKLDGAPN